MPEPALVLSLGFLAALGLVTHASGQGWLGFALAPLVLLVYRLDSYRFMLLAFACYLLFFEASNPSSTFLFFDIPDVFLLLFAAMALLSRSRPFAASLPRSGLLLLLGLFVAYGFALSLRPFLVYGFDVYVLRDIKNLVYLSLAIPFCLPGREASAPGNVLRLLLAIVGFSALHALTAVAEPMSGAQRATTWNEVYFADAILICAALLRLDWGRGKRTLLLAGMAACILGLLATQTRGLWLSTAGCLAVYGAMLLARERGTGWRRMAAALPTALAIAFVAEGLMRVAMGQGLLDFVVGRFGSWQPDELINPYSSMGYRLHESAAVWEQRSWFGHGSGARLYLFFTQLGMSRFINWWSIHSEYFELLHKYGFVGLGIFLAFLAALLRRTWTVAMRASPAASVFGMAAFLTVLNHAVVSITSGYLIRENVMLHLVLAVIIAVRFRPRKAGPPAAEGAAATDAAPGG